MSHVYESLLHRKTPEATDWLVVLCGHPVYTNFLLSSHCSKIVFCIFSIIEDQSFQIFVYQEFGVAIF